MSIFAHREAFHIIERHSTCFLLYSILLIQYFLSVSHPSTIYFLKLLAHSNFNFFLYCCTKNNPVVKLGNNARSTNTKPNHYRKLLYIIYIRYELEQMFRLQSRKDFELPLFLIYPVLWIIALFIEPKSATHNFCSLVSLSKMFGGSSFNWLPPNHQ